MYRARHIVDRRSNYLQAHYAHWADYMRLIAMGVVLMSTMRAANAHGKVHFPHLAIGCAMMRSHGCQVSLYDDGSFLLSIGVFAEYITSRCKQYAECDEGSFRFVGDRGDVPMKEEDIVSEMDRVYLSISCYAERREDDELTPCVNIDGGRRGAKRRRPWTNAEFLDPSNAAVCIEEMKVAGELTTLTLDIWHLGTRNDASTKWGDASALNDRSQSQKIPDAVSRCDVIP